MCSYMVGYSEENVTLIFLGKLKNSMNNENDVLFQKVTQAYSEKKSECSYQESNLRPSDY